MRNRSIVLLVLLLPVLPLSGATKIFMRDTASPLGVLATDGPGVGCFNNNQRYVWRQANTTQGSSAQTRTFAPTSTSPPCLGQTATSSGDFLMWISPPISSSVTISGNIDYQGGCNESATQLNGGFRFVVQRWSQATGGIDATIHTSADTTECTAAGNKTIAAAAPTSTVMAVGDRIVFKIQVRAVGAWGGNGVRTFSIIYDAGAGATGDTFANFADTISFSADTNNSRTILSDRSPNRRSRPLSRLWKSSAALLLASHSLDSASSLDRPELNPLLRSPSGRFSTRGLVLKSTVAAAVLSLEYFLIRRDPHFSKPFTAVNLAGSAILTTTAIHNWRLP